MAFHNIFQIVAPQIIRDKVLESLPNTRISGNLGRDKTYEGVRRDFTGLGWQMMSNFGVYHVLFVHVKHRT